MTVMKFSLFFGRGFEGLGFVFQLFDEVFVGGGADDIGELPAIVTGHTNAIYHNVIHMPFPGITQQPIIYREFPLRAMSLVRTSA